MKDSKNVRSCFTRVHLWVCVFALASVSVGARAQPVANPAPTNPFQYIYQVNAGGFAKYSPPNLTASSTANQGFSAGANGDVFASGKGSFRPSTGAPIIVDVQAKIPKAAAAAAIGKAAVKLASAASGLSTAYAVGGALYDLAKELGLNPHIGGASGNFPGLPVVDQAFDSVTCRAPDVCYGYTGNKYQFAYKAADAACREWAAYNNRGYVSVAGVSGEMYCTVSGYSQTFKLDAKVVPETTSSSINEVPLDHGLPSAIGKPGVSFDPATSALPRAVVKAIESLGPGESIGTESPVVSGPASSPGTAPVTRVDSIAKTSTVTTTTNQYTYSGDTISNTTKVTNVTTNTETNTVINNTTETSAPDVPKPETEPTPEYCVEHPTAAGCVELGEAPAPDVMAKTSHAVAITAALFASSNGCPSPIPITAFGRSYAISYQPLCDRLVYVRVLFLAMAGVGAAFILSNSFKV
jgi:hypothetical protein